MENKEKRHRIRLEKYDWDQPVKKKNSLLTNIFVTIVILFIIGCGALEIYNKFSFYNSETNADKIQNILDEDWLYVDSNAGEELFSTGLSSKDKYARYYNKEEAKEFNELLGEGNKKLGLSYLIVNNKYIVLEVTKNSPAEKAGIKFGDIVESMYDDNNELIPVDVESSYISEQEEVIINVKRDNKIIKLTLIPDYITTSVNYYIKDDIGVIELYEFDYNADKEVEKALQLFKEEDINKLIIDLRDNPGGYVTTVTSISGMLIGPEKVVLKEIYRDKTSETIKTSKNAIKYNFDNVVVLVNENSASGSEALAGNLQDYNIATVVGVPTYKKGTVQTTIDLYGGEMLKFTIGEWTRMNGNKVDGVGITPDVIIETNVTIQIEQVEINNDIKLGYTGNEISEISKTLNYLGYNINQQDIFDNNFLIVINEFQKDNNLEITNVMNYDTYEKILSEYLVKYEEESRINENQFNKALELVNKDK